MAGLRGAGGGDLAVLGVVFGGYILLARPGPAALYQRKAIRVLNRGTGAVMAGAAAAIAFGDHCRGHNSPADRRCARVMASA